MNAYLHHFSYEFRAGVRDKSLMFMNYLFPLAFFALAGALMSGINPGFNQYMIPAMSVFAVMSCFLLGMPSSLVASRDAGVLRSYRINGVPGWTSLAMPVAANVIHMAVITGTISLIGSVAMSAQLPDHVGVFVLGWVLGTAAIAGLGALVSVIAGSSRSATLLAQLVFIPSIILGGLMTPPDALSKGLTTIAKLWPATEMMNVLRTSDGWWISAVALGLGAVLAFVAAAMLYEWDPKNQRPARRKLIAVVALLPYVAVAALALV
jgi:ABC-2 type transport system permease protein